MSDSKLTKEIKKELKNYSHTPGSWLYFEELRDSTGWDARTIDMFAMQTWPSKGFTRIAFEIKISMSDFYKDIGNKRKQARFMKHSNYFYYVTPVGLIKNYDKIPEGCGLIEYKAENWNGPKPRGNLWRKDRKFKVIVKAEFKDNPPDWRIIMVLARRLNKLERKK